MQDIDKLIDEALGAEEAELLRRIGGGRPGLTEQMFGLFGGGPGMVGLVMAAQLVLAGAGAFAGWRFFQASDPVTQLRWGLPAAVLVLMALIVKAALGPTLLHNRVLRELKRIELQLARTRE
jgi:hypothetical protein